jgi:hypothetical protein
MPLNQKLITKISQFSLLSLLTTTASIVSTPPRFSGNISSRI